MPYTTIEKENGVAVVWLDQPGEKVNKLAADLVDEFHALLDQLQQDSEVQAIVLISKKKDTFIAGADLERLLALKEPGQVEALSRSGQAVLDRVAAFPKPIVAAIHGAALGGGLEVALACHARIATDDPKTILGQPEVKLGLLPAAGGTQRLPRLVGLQKALDIMLTGKNVYPRQAKKMGLVDALIHPYGLLNAARQMALELVKNPKKHSKKQNLMNTVLEGNPFTRKIIYKKAREMTQKQTQGNYPAPFKIIDCVEIGMEQGMKAGLDAEARGFEELAHTPQAEELINLFFSMTHQKKNPLKSKVREVNTIGILGAGLMGSGIAEVSASKGYEIFIKDISLQAIASGEKRIWDNLDGRVKKRALSAFERDKIMSRIHGVTDYHGFEKANLVIEAVFEDLQIKQQVLAEVEAVTPKQCIFASNTSSIPISRIAEKAKRPKQVIGMHYFSPVPKMPLLEIIITPQTAQWVTATAIDVGIRQGKTVVVVKDGPGFYTTRILSPMMNEALLLLEEGGDVLHIDRVMKKFGFPVGPFTLMDEVGMDVGAHVAEILKEMFAERGVQSTDAMEKLVEAGYKGRKSRKGFYLYDQKGRKQKEVDQTVYRYFGGTQRKKHAPQEIQERLVMVMVNEAALCLQEEILSSPRDGDLGAVLGLGFPPFLGGPFRYIDRLGVEKVVTILRKLEEKHGNRFTPAPILLDYANNQKRFYEEK
ncbi:MAG: fatty acid oxidation complex subunit alpha FadJ [Calditrichaeota bacterium]|nr:MAG: fatty acid oxidation complex subunit alpha FadJ [Calditrichota bacterium]